MSFKHLGIFVLFFFFLFPNPSQSSEAKYADVRNLPVSGSEIESHLLKLESQIDEMRVNISRLNKQVSDLDLALSTINAKVNSLVKSDNLSDTSNIRNSVDNLPEFQYGFEQLVEGNYDLASRSFDLFIVKYPADPKKGEAYFWLGEALFKMKNYSEASKNYLIAYRDYQANPRRNEALFKLSITLSLLGKKGEACSGFDILLLSNNVDTSLKRKILDEVSNLGCDR